MHSIAIAGLHARVIVVIKEQQRRVIADLRLHIIQFGAEGGHIQFVDEGHLRVHRQMKLRLAGWAVHLSQFGDVGQIGLADQHARAGKGRRAEGIRMSAHLLHHRMHAG